MKKRIFVFTLLILLLTPLITFPISAESPLAGTCGDNAYWRYDESTKTLTISGTGAIYDYDFLSPPRDPSKEPNDNKAYENPPPWYNKEETYRTFEKLVIEDGITRIGEQAFCKSYMLREVSMGPDVTIIGEKAFFLCENLQTVSLSKSLIEIEPFAFCRAVNLSRIELPDTLVSIGESAFDETALTALKLPESIETIGRMAIPFSVREIHIPKNLREIELNAFGDIGDVYLSRRFDRITVDPENPYYRMEQGCLVDVKNAFVYYSENATGIPEGMKIIYCCAFVGNTTLPSDLVIPEGVLEIGDEAFLNCEHLNTIRFPASFQFLGYRAFDGCYGVESVMIDEENAYYYADGRSLISKEDQRLVLHFATAPIPEEVTVIGYFSIICDSETYEVRDGIEEIQTVGIFGQHLKELTLPRSLTYLDILAFQECRVLTDIYYKGTRAEWNTLTANFKEEAGRNWTDEKMWFNRVAVHCIDEIEETTAGSESETGDPNITTQPPTPTGCGSTVSLPWIALVMIVPIAVMARKREKR